MTKEEFLAMSYTGDLIIHCDRNIYSYKGELKNTNLCYDSTVNKFYISKNGTPFEIDNIKPVLHPLSDLIKEIEHKGEKFIPIIKLAELGANENFKNHKCYMINNTYIIETIEWFSNISVKTTFEIDTDDGDFGFCVFNTVKRKDSDYPVSCQLTLFQKLVEWHFDIANLIQKGEAIDINTLEINPYK